MITFLKTRVRALSWLLLLVALPLSALGQKSVSGVVFEDDGKTPLTGATVMQKGHAKNAISTDIDGKYKINLTGKNPVIVVSFIGYDPQEIAVDGRATVDVTMKTNSVKLDDVVVTALGITREQKSLGYAVSKVSNEELTNTVSGNWLNAMNGKVAGMTMDAAGTGPMGSVRVVLRGDQSLNYGSNEALFVVDGVPISSGTTTSGSGGNYSNTDGPVDFGNDAADINPEDVESVSVLKGPAATALYGSRAANGAIVITTKSGKTNKGIGVTVNSSVTWERAGWMPDFQGEYGPGSDLGAVPFSQWAISAKKSPTGQKITKNYSRYAFGEKFDANKLRYPYSAYNWDDDTFTGKPWVYADDWYTGLFKTGVTYNNSVTVEGGNGKGTSARVSITDTRNEWILPNTGYKKDAVSVSFNTKLNKWISLSSRVNYYNKRADNIPMSGYSQNTPTYHAMWGLTCNPFSDYAAEYFNGRINEETWENRYVVVPNSGVLGNPLRYLYEETNSIDKNRMVGNVNLKIKLPVKGLSLNLRAAVDMNDEFRTMRKSRWSSGYPNGGYKEQSIRKNETNLDFLLRYENNKWFNKRMSFNVSFGGNTMTNKYYTENIHLKNLEIPGIYNVNNAPATSIPVPYHYRSKKVVNSFYGFASLGWDNTYFLDVTGRNDWSSTLARGHWSFFYPSVAASVLLDQAFKMQERGAQWIDMLKLRLSWANVGNDTSAYALLDAYSTSDFTGGFTVPTTMANKEIKPENVESWEAGLEMRFLQNRIGFDAAVYTSSTTDQIVSAKVEDMSGASGVRINAGEIRNRGIELSAHFVPVRTRDFEWSIDANWSKNWNKLVSLQDDWDPTQPLQTNMGTTIGGRVFCYSYVGEEMNYLYGIGYKRAEDNAVMIDENGNKISVAGQKIITEKDGYPQLTPDATVKLGKVNPDWNAGLSMRFRYKQVSLSANFTAQMGGHAYSVTNFVLAYQGKTKSTLPGRMGGFVVDGVNFVGYETGADGKSIPVYKKNTTVVDNIQQYYTNYAYKRDNGEGNTFKTDFLKLKELRLDYALPKNICKRTKVLRSASIGAYATNVFCISDWPQFDPETGTLSGTEVHRGIETGAMPMTRTYGVNIKLAF